MHSRTSTDLEGTVSIKWTKGRCVDLTGGKLSNGNQVQIWSCNSNEDNNNQIWDAGYMYAALFLLAP